MVTQFPVYSDFSTNRSNPEDNPRNLYLRLALPYVPRVLHLLDQNPYSPNYGSFDRDTLLQRS